MDFFMILRLIEMNYFLNGCLNYFTNFFFIRIEYFFFNFFKKMSYLKNRI